MGCVMTELILWFCFPVTIIAVCLWVECLAQGYPMRKAWKNARKAQEIEDRLEKLLHAPKDKKP